jgi:hypothetical protein
MYIYISPSIYGEYGCVHWNGSLILYGLKKDEVLQCVRTEAGIRLEMGEPASTEIVKWVRCPWVNINVSKTISPTMIDEVYISPYLR